MDREAARNYIIEHSAEYLTPDNSQKGYVCPICGSGTGKKGTGITTKDNKHFTCWAGCFQHSDIIDIIGLEYGIEDYNSKFSKAAELFNVEIDHGYTPQKEAAWSQKEQKPKNKTKMETSADFTKFFEQAAANIEQTDYHRGISLETLKRFKIGYMEKWRHPKVSSLVPETPRLIIPTSKYSYLARDTRPDLTDQQKQYSKSKVGEVHIFNAEAVQHPTGPLFIVEGELDALSIIDVGGEAIGLGSIGNRQKMIDLISQYRPKQPIIICMDNDERGKEASADMAAALLNLGVKYFVMDIAKPYKDANEALIADRDAFKEKVLQAVTFEKRELEKESVAFNLPDFLGNIEKSKTAAFYSTGFTGVDSVLDGGLYAGLYVVGAISSLGKTTFCMQVADNIARNGNDVLIFSLEMARDELIAKSVSRETFMIDRESGTQRKLAKTTRGILTGSRWSGYSKEETEAITKAIENYWVLAPHIYITEGVGDVTVEKIREKIERHISLTGKKPVVFIDYLQIIAPADIRATDKQNTDKAVLELKRITRDFGLPIVGISSFNRENYTAPVNLSSFKESGSIEYSSDVLIGLQYDGMDYEEKESEKNRTARVRDLLQDMVKKGKSGEAQSIQVKILKNRNGSKGDAYVKFYPMFNYFEDHSFEEEFFETPPDEWIKAESNF